MIMDISKELQMIKDSKIVAIIRGVSSSDIVDAVQAMFNGGIRCCEVTFDHTSKEAMDESLKSIQLLREAFDGKVAVGAGTVLDTDDVELAKKAGASFIISPNYDPDTIKLTKSYGLISIPGAMTPTEVYNCYKAGADFVKVFPASDLGTSFIKSLRGPLPFIPLMAVGGITAENLNDYLKAGCSGVGIGGNLVNKKLIKAHDFEALENLAKTFVAE